MFTLNHVLRSPILEALLHGTRAVAVSQTLWRGTRNGITELSQRAISLFGWTAMTLGNRSTLNRTFVKRFLVNLIKGAQVWHVVAMDHRFTCHPHVYPQMERAFACQSHNPLAATHFPYIMLCALVYFFCHFFLCLLLWAASIDGRLPPLATCHCSHYCAVVLIYLLG